LVKLSGRDEDFSRCPTVILRYSDPKLANSSSPPRFGAQYFQFGVFNAANNGNSLGNPVTLTNLGWSRSADPASFTTFLPSFVTGAGSVSSPDYNYTSIVPVPSPPMGTPFFLRYTIPAGFTALDDVLATTFLFYNNSATVPAPPRTPRSMAPRKARFLRPEHSSREVNSPVTTLRLFLLPCRFLVSVPWRLVLLGCGGVCVSSGSFL
jgi:hypothetical protein